MGILLKNIGKSFGEPATEVLKNISFSIADGEFLALTGRSGSGKSTLLYLLSTLDNPTSGEIIIDDTSVHEISERDIHRFRNLKMGFIFQFHYLLPELTALENILMPARKTERERERLEFGKHLLNQFDLGDKHDRFPGQLSGGEQQRVAIARALVMEPRYLFADEPTGNLDSINGDLVMDILRETNRTNKTTVVLVTHDPDFAGLARRQIHLVDGQVAASA